MASTIFLCRHGASRGNVAQRLLGKNEDKLTEIGKTQANLLGLFLADVPFDEIYSSDYDRAVDTAKLIIKHNQVRSDQEICEYEELREINYGIFKGELYEEAIKYCKGTGKDILDWEFPDGESFKISGERILEFWEKLCDRLTSGSSPKTVLIVSHSVAMINFLSLLPTHKTFNLVNWSPEQDFKVMKNASYMKISVERMPINQLNEAQYNATFIEKHVTDHYSCIEQGSGPEFGVKKFVKRPDQKEFRSCIQQ